jgi:hypothetical protein
MFNLNRRQFLLQSTLTLAAAVTYDQVKAQKPTSPGALPKGLPRRKVLIVGAVLKEKLSSKNCFSIGRRFCLG